MAEGDFGFVSQDECFSLVFFFISYVFLQRASSNSFFILPFILTRSGFIWKLSNNSSQVLTRKMKGIRKLVCRALATSKLTFLRVSEIGLTLELLKFTRVRTFPAATRSQPELSSIGKSKLRFRVSRGLPIDVHEVDYGNVSINCNIRT